LFYLWGKKEEEEEEEIDYFLIQIVFLPLVYVYHRQKDRKGGQIHGRDD